MKTITALLKEGVVLGGGGYLAELERRRLSDGPFWNSFVASTRRHIWSEDCRHLPIVRAATGADAGLIGAAVAARQQFQASGPPIP